MRRFERLAVFCESSAESMATRPLPLGDEVQEISTRGGKHGRNRGFTRIGDRTGWKPRMPIGVVWIGWIAQERGRHAAVKTGAARDLGARDDAPVARGRV